MSNPKRIIRAIVCGQWVDAPEGDYYVTCSFDANHVILRSRMPYHIVKCLKVHAGHTKVPCPYDFTEYIEKDEIHEHIKRCEFRSNTCDSNFQKAKVIASGKCGAVREMPFFHNLPPPDEDWGGCEATEESRVRLEEEERVRRDARPDKVIDGSDSEDEAGVGRGVGGPPKRAPPPPRGMGRAELFKRLFAQYKEMKARGLCDRDNFGPHARPAGAQPSADGQFDDSVPSASSA